MCATGAIPAALSQIGKGRPAGGSLPPFVREIVPAAPECSSVARGVMRRCAPKSKKMHKIDVPDGVLIMPDGILIMLINRNALAASNVNREGILSKGGHDGKTIGHTYLQHT